MSAGYLLLGFVLRSYNYELYTTKWYDEKKNMLSSHDFNINITYKLRYNKSLYTLGWRLRNSIIMFYSFFCSIFNHKIIGQPDENSIIVRVSCQDLGLGAFVPLIPLSSLGNY